MHYEPYWGLKASPFENVPDPRFYFPSTKHEEGLHRLLYGIQARKGAVLLTGEIGCGKTTLSRKLIQHLAQDRYDTALIANPSIDAQEFLGEVLYQFLADSGWLDRMSRAATARDEAEVQNISRFFNRVRDAAGALRYDNVGEFIKHLDALIEAGDDPAVAEADTETPAVRVLTVHKAKGLEFPVVFLVHLVQEKFPLRRRREQLEVPPELVNDILPSGDFHMQEERRLFYVGMTRARRELYLTSARDYGGTRPRKVSQFVLEALDLPKDAAKPFKARPVEEIQRFAPSGWRSRSSIARGAPFATPTVTADVHPSPQAPALAARPFCGRCQCLRVPHSVLASGGADALPVPTRGRRHPRWQLALHPARRRLPRHHRQRVAHRASQARRFSLALTESVPIVEDVK